MKIIIILLLVIFISLSLSSQSATATWWNTSWGKCKNIIIDSGDIDEDLTNFPLLVKFNSTRIDYSLTQNLGQDIRFVNASCNNGGAVLSHEIETWNESGDSPVWVKTNLTSGSDTNISVYYDSATASDGQDSLSVWDNNFIAVYHMDYISNNDSTGSFNLSSVHTPISGVTFGKIGTGIDLQSGDEDYFNDGDNGDNISAITVSAWFNADSLSSDYSGIVCKCAEVEESWFFQVAPTDNNVGWRVDTNDGNSALVEATVTTNKWYYFTGTWDSGIGNFTIYINGTRISSLPRSGATVQDSTGIVRIGYSGWPGQFFDGSIDEVRISNTNRSNAWIKADYESTRNDLIVFGAEETASDAISPLISIHHPINNQQLPSNQNWSMLNCSATDNINLSTLSFYSNHTGLWLLNFTNSTPFNDTATKLNLTGLPDGAILWSCTACDNISNCNSSANYTFYISSYSESNPPVISSYSQNSTYVSELTNHTFIATDETNLFSYIFSFDNGAGTFVNDSMTAISGILYTASITKVISSDVGDIIQWQIYINDTLGNMFSSPIQIYTATTRLADGGGAVGGGSSIDIPELSSNQTIIIPKISIVTNIQDRIYKQLTKSFYMGFSIVHVILFIIIGLYYTNLYIKNNQKLSYKQQKQLYISLAMATAITIITLS